MARQHQDDIAFVGVGGLDDLAEIEAFVDRHELGHVAHAISEDGELFARFEIVGQPAWVLIDAEGAIVLRAVRPSTDEVRAALVELGSTG